jgi:hypothetical protein
MYLSKSPVEIVAGSCNAFYIGRREGSEHLISFMGNATYAGLSQLLVNALTGELGTETNLGGHFELRTHRFSVNI